MGWWWSQSGLRTVRSPPVNRASLASRLSVVAASNSLSTDCAEQAECHAKHKMGIGAGDGSRTRDIQLGRLTLYRLSYSRPFAFVC
jgi:hypothetical protein